MDDLKLTPQYPASLAAIDDARRARSDKLSEAERRAQAWALAQELLDKKPDTDAAQNVSRETLPTNPLFKGGPGHWGQVTALAEKLKANEAPKQGGVKFDQGKPRMDLVPVRPLLDEARVWAFGAAKYADRNWEKGMDWSRPYAAALRHLVAWWGGENTDPETGYSHLAHARCCLAMLQEFEVTHKELDNRP